MIPYAAADELDDDDDNNASCFLDDMEALKRACSLNPNPNNDDGDDEDGFNQDMETLRRARLLAGDGVGYGNSSEAEESDDDFELLRRIKRKYSDIVQDQPSIFVQPATSDDDEADFETLRAIKSRFNIQTTSEDLSIPNSEQVCVSDEETVINSIDLLEFSNSNSNFPNSAHRFIEAIKRNRAYQKFLRDKVQQIEARIAENNKLKENVRIVKTFQTSCKKNTGKALSLKKDFAVQLISPPKCKKVNGKKASPKYFGPEDNSHVANYQMVLKKFPLSFPKKQTWSVAERENLVKGVKQEFQQVLLEKSGSISSNEDPDMVIASIKNLEVTPEYMRLYLPKVDWNKFPSNYVKAGRSGAECEARWLNFEDPLINHNKWTAAEEKSLLLIVQQKGMNNWIDIAVSLGTNRTPFQCLVRYQRSLNTYNIKSSGWTEEEDNQLRKAVQTFGEGNWQLIASTLEDRTGTQCSNRYIKSLHPDRQRVGMWTPDEDTRLKVAMKLFGHPSWKKLAEFVPGRTKEQCRERWVNILNPCLNFGKWTEEEDSKLKAAVAEHTDQYGRFRWSKIAACVPSRTDNQCWRRWMALFPNQVPLLKAARKIQKAALVSNFVDRESERPALSPLDFLPLPISEPENTNPSIKGKRKPRRNEKESASSKSPGKIKSKRPRKKARICSEKDPSMTNSDDETIASYVANKSLKPCLKGKACVDSSYHVDSSLLMVDNGESDAAFGGHDNTAMKKRSPKPSSKSVQNDEGAADRNATMSSNHKRASRRHDNTTKNKKLSKSYLNKNGCALSGECMDSGVCEEENPKRSVMRSKPCSMQVSETSDEDDITLSCMLKQLLIKKRKI